MEIEMEKNMESEMVTEAHTWMHRGLQDPKP